MIARYVNADQIRNPLNPGAKQNDKIHMNVHLRKIYSFYLTQPICMPFISK